MTSNLDAGLRSTPASVFTVADRTCPSFATWISMIFSFFHTPRLSVSSQIKTTSPICIGSLHLNHLVRRVRVGKYSRNHRFQKVCINCCRICHFRQLPVFVHGLGNQGKKIFGVSGSSSYESIGMVWYGMVCGLLATRFVRLAQCIVCSSHQIYINVTAQ